MNQHDNPFMDEEEPEMDMPLQQLFGSINGESFKLFGTRRSNLTITVSRDVDINPERDSTILLALLSTSIETETFQRLVNKIYREFIVPQLAKDYSAPTRKPRTKRKPPLNDKDS